MTPKFFGEFESVADIDAAFRVTTGLTDRDIIAAGYFSESYEGSAVVIYRDADGRVFEANGSHCSCYGLEGQWEPEPASIADLQQRFSQERLPYMVDREFAAAVLAGLPPIVEE